jgi:hypothetical protein
MRHDCRHFQQQGRGASLGESEERRMNADGSGLYQLYHDGSGLYQINTNIITRLKLTCLERYVHFRREIPLTEVVERYNATHKRQVDFNTIMRARDSLLEKERRDTNQTK